MSDEANIAANGAQGTARPTGEPTVPDVSDQAYELTRVAKETGQKLRELQGAVDSLEQAALFQEPEFEEALLMPSAELQKRYTGEHAQQIEHRRLTAAYMLQIGCPVEHIAKLLHMNKRLVVALATELGKATAQFTDGYATELLKMAGEFFAQARTRIGEASPLQAATAGGILVDKALQVKLMGASSEMGLVIETEQESEALQSARAFLKSKRENKVVPDGQPAFAEAVARQGEVAE